MTTLLKHMTTRTLKATIRHLALKGEDVTDAYREFKAREGRDQVEALVLYSMEETVASRTKFDQNRRIRKAVHRAELNLRCELDREPDPQPVAVGRMGLDLARGNMVIDPDDLPQGKMIANYSGQLQGGYMGSRTKHIVRKVGRVKYH